MLSKLCGYNNFEYETVTKYENKWSLKYISPMCCQISILTPEELILRLFY